MRGSSLFDKCSCDPSDNSFRGERCTHTHLFRANLRSAVPAHVPRDSWIRFKNHHRSIAVAFHPRQRRLGPALSSSKPNKSQIRRSMGLSSSVLQRSIFVIVKVEVPQFQQLLTAERASLFGGGVSATAPAPSKDFLAGLQFTTSN